MKLKVVHEKFENTKGVMKSRNMRKNRQCYGQGKRDIQQQQTNNGW